MNPKQTFFEQLGSLKNLPTLPHILLKLYEVCSREDVDLEEVAAIVGQDPSLSTKILNLVNSAYFGLPQEVQEIGQAVALVGTRGIKNLAICACVYEAFPKPGKDQRFNLKNFWWHSLRCAYLSKKIAVEMEFSHPDDAFIAGLLHDVGKVVLWVYFDSRYEEVLEKYSDDKERLLAEETRLGAPHGKVSAWLLNRWKFQTVVSDSVRYHHESTTRISQALPLAQIMYVANILCQDFDADIGDGIFLAQDLLGLSSKECHTLMEASFQQAKEVAASIGMDIDTDVTAPLSVDASDQQQQAALVQDVQNMSLLMGTLEGFLTAKDQSGILSVISEGLKILLDIDRCICFLVDVEKGVLFGYIRDKEGRFVKKHSFAVSLTMNKSLLVRSLLERKQLNSFTAAAQSPLTILDEQIIRLTGGAGIYCLPLNTNGDSVGVLVLAIQESDLPHLEHNEKLLKIFIHKGALALHLDYLKGSQLQDIQTKRADASSDLAKRVVHEVNNPLSIIKNYLKILELKLNGNGVATDEIRIINEEITRVSSLLKKLTDFSTDKVPPREIVDINALLTDIVKITKESLRRESDVKLTTNLKPHLPPVSAEKAGLKQVFINLIKNANEAMEEGGNLFIRTRYFPPPIGSRHKNGKRNAHGHVEIQIIDDGPGIPEEIKEKLFDPYVGSKEGEHAGLGLSIVYNIIKSFNGHIACKSIPGKGTAFRIELPIHTASSARKT